MRDFGGDPDVLSKRNALHRVEEIAPHRIAASRASIAHIYAENRHPNSGHMNPPPASASAASSAKSAEELRRSSLNMEKMIKKNVLAASRPGGMKRGLAVVEFFKQQQQQSQTPTGGGADDADASGSSAKRSKKDGLTVSTSGAASASSSSAVLSPSASLRPSASSLVGPPTTPLVPKSDATTALLTAAVAAHRGSPLRTASSAGARASPLRPPPRASPMRAVKASPLRQVFTSPSRRVVAPRLPEVTTTAAGGGVPPMHHTTPALNLDAVDTPVSALKPPVLPAKSPFQSFQSKKLGQSKGVVKTPSPARPTPQPPARHASPMPQHLEPEIVDLSEEKPSPPSQNAAKMPSSETQEKDTLVMTTPPAKPLARSLFGSASAACVATKSLCFSTEGVASSLDASPDGECIVVAFMDGSVRLYEMDSTVPSDRHGYLLGHLDEESNQSSAGAHLRVKISGDGRYAFVGCRSGPRVMMSVNLHNYRNGKDTEDEDMDQLQKSFHSNTRLRGFSDAMVCPPVEGFSSRAYYLLCGLGIGTLHLWQFVETSSRSDPEWKALFSISTNASTLVVASFLPQDLGTSSLLRIAAKGEDKNVRVWNLEPSSNSEDEGGSDPPAHALQGHFDIPSSKDVVAFYGHHAYGIAPTGEACRFRIPFESAAVVRTFFEIERLDMGGSSSSSSKSRRSNVILESIYASDDGRAVVAVSAEGIFYYTNRAPDGDASSSDGSLLRIIGRNASLNAQYKSPMKVLKPVQTDGTMLEAVMAVVTNPQSEDDGDDGYVNVDTTDAWAARWMKPSRGYDCWVCGVRNIRHWPAESSSQAMRTSPVERTRAAKAPASSASTKVSPRPFPSTKSKPKPSVSSDSSPGSPVAPSKPRGIGEVSRPTKPVHVRSSDDHDASGTHHKKAKTSDKPAPVKRLDIESAAVATSDEKPSGGDARSYVQQLEQELARYKERHTKIVTEWKRRLKGERQMRRLWKDREKEFEEQLHETLLKLDAAEQKMASLGEAHKHAEKKFILEKLKADQQSSVKVRYEKLCEQMQERMAGLEHQQRLMEQTSRALLQEVDRHVHHAKQAVDGLVDRQQNECILCKDRAAVTAIVPCGHLCFCEDDAEVYRRNFRGGDAIACPICQRELISMLRIY